jgi:hypothetical protein
MIENIEDQILIHVHTGYIVLTIPRDYAQLAGGQVTLCLKLVPTSPLQNIVNTL